MQNQRHRLKVVGMRVQRSKRFALNFNNGSKPFGSQQLQKSLFFHFSLFLNLLDGVANLIDGWNGGAGTTNHSVIDHLEGATFNKFASASAPCLPSTLETIAWWQGVLEKRTRKPRLPTGERPVV
ncbi:hypothetical protein LT723_22875 [Pseudomonas syringae pv. syringae]|nr:hypothetical protein [Pseudomonas syringae pv. syringae]